MSPRTTNARHAGTRDSGAGAADGAEALRSATAPLDAERLAGLVFELASQLHAERLHRLVLEAALERAGVLPAAALAAAAEDPAVRARARAAVEESVGKLVRVLAEQPDARTPLRADEPRAAAHDRTQRGS